ncbi:GSCOCG00005310001-RA-CDS, partial [Cotesia congregata]
GLIRINSDAQAVADWAKEVGLELNLGKTKVMILGSSRKLKLLKGFDLPEIIVDGNVIPYVSSTKHLGVYLSAYLSWDLHVSQISRKVYGTLNNLKYRKNILSTSTRKLLVAAMVIPIIDYCSLVLMDVSKSLDYKLQRLVNNGIRFIFNLKRDEHITPHRRSLQWLTVKSKRYYFLACFLYKLFNSGEPKFLRSMFVEESPDVRRSERVAARQNNITFKIPNFSTISYEHSFLISSIRLWRELPPDVINALSIDTFKTKAYQFFHDLE